jgi:hypothetical protein
VISPHIRADLAAVRVAELVRSAERRRLICTVSRKDADSQQAPRAVPQHPGRASRLVRFVITR